MALAPSLPKRKTLYTIRTLPQAIFDTWMQALDVYAGEHLRGMYWGLNDFGEDNGARCAWGVYLDTQHCGVANFVYAAFMSDIDNKLFRYVVDLHDNKGMVCKDIAKKLRRNRQRALAQYRARDCTLNLSTTMSKWTKLMHKIGEIA